VILHEAALRMEFGGPAIARRQLEHLLRMSEREAVTRRSSTPSPNQTNTEPSWTPLRPSHSPRPPRTPSSPRWPTTS